MNTTLPRLLIVDDEERIRRLFMELMEDYGEFQIFGVHSGEEGLDILSAEPADLCLVDLRLPGMDGVSFILEAKKRGLCRRFFLHTGSVEFALSPALRQAGVTEKDVYFKPNDLDRLEGDILAVLRNREC